MTIAQAGLARGWMNKLFLNAVAVLGALIGLGNAALAWRVFGLGTNADIWMTSVVMLQAFILLSQLGVEQVSVFAAEMRVNAQSETEANLYDRDCLTWAMFWGMAFSSLIFLVVKSTVSAFADGFTTQGRLAVAGTFGPLLLQVAAAPSQYVLRQHLLIGGRAKAAVTLNILFPGIQCACLLTAWGIGGMSPAHVGWMLGSSSAAFAIISLYALGQRGVGYQVPNLVWIWPMIKASFALRLTHSIHNFLVVMLTNTALSAGVSGTIAIFQYTKKIADGLAAISIGPHLAVYHAAQANAWAKGNASDFKSNLEKYAKSAAPLFFTAVLLFFGAAAFYVTWLQPELGAFAKSSAGLLAILLAWAMVIVIESVSVGVIVQDRQPKLILMVNAIYLLVFYTGISVALKPPFSASAVATLSLSCQLVSITIFSLLALRLYRRKFRS